VIAGTDMASVTWNVGEGDDAEHKEKVMRRFTLFTFLYLVAGVCLTAIALGHPDVTLNAKTSLSVAAGLLYLCAVFTTFPFWHQSVQRSQARLRDKPAWQQNFVAIAPWLVIGSVIISAIVALLNHSSAIEALASAALGLPIIFLSVENLFVRNQIRQ
jgi:NADH:ubiquinone oxidoreductase subunit 6 (subunit J)